MFLCLLWDKERGWSPEQGASVSPLYKTSDTVKHFSCVKVFSHDMLTSQRWRVISVGFTKNVLLHVCISSGCFDLDCRPCSFCFWPAWQLRQTVRGLDTVRILWGQGLTLAQTHCVCVCVSVYSNQIWGSCGARWRVLLDPQYNRAHCLMSSLHSLHSW